MSAAYASPVSARRLGTEPSFSLAKGTAQGTKLPFELRTSIDSSLISHYPGCQASLGLMMVKRAALMWCSQPPHWSLGISLTGVVGIW